MEEPLMLFGLNIRGIDVGPELSGMFWSADWLWLTGTIGGPLVDIDGGSRGVIGGTPLGNMVVVTGLVIPDCPRTLT